jgi:hypothetical protein
MKEHDELKTDYDNFPSTSEEVINDTGLNIEQTKELSSSKYSLLVRFESTW